jgi:hypothetical protein
VSEVSGLEPFSFITSSVSLPRDTRIMKGRRTARSASHGPIRNTHTQTGFHMNVDADTSRTVGGRTIVSCLSPVKITVATGRLNRKLPPTSFPSYLVLEVT